MSDAWSIACIGAGVIGRSWAVAFAAGGQRVRVHDVQPLVLDRARAFVEAALTQMHAYGLCADLNQALAAVSFHRDLESALAGAAYVQESAVESVAFKADLFATLDAACAPDVVLASSTSTIPASQFTEGLPGARRCLVAHPINPPHLIPVVEVSPGPATDPSVTARAVEILAAAGREPIVVRKELSGFLINRLQLAVIGEALHLVGEGYCSAADLDRALRLSLGLRWALFGPFEAGHLNADTGYGDYMRKFKAPMKALIGDLKVDYEWSDELLNRVSDELSRETPPDAIPLRQNERDSRLMALARHLKSADDGGE